MHVMSEYDSPRRQQYSRSNQASGAGFLCRLLLCTLLACISLPSAAQQSGSDGEASAVPAELGPEAMQSLVSKLDEEQTAALVELIQLLGNAADAAALEEQESSEAALETVRQWVESFRRDFASHLQSFPQMSASIGQTVIMVFTGREDGGRTRFLMFLGLSLLFGIAAEWLFRRGTAKVRESIREAQPEALMETLKVLSLRAMIETGGVIAFTLAAVIAANTLVGGEDNRFLVVSMLVTVVLITRLAISLMRFVLAPHRPELRLVYTDSWTARFVYRHVVMVAAFTSFGFFLASVMQRFDIAHLDSVRF